MQNLLVDAGTYIFTIEPRMKFNLSLGSDVNVFQRK